MSVFVRPQIRRMAKEGWTVEGWVLRDPRETRTTDHELGKRSFM